MYGLSLVAASGGYSAVAEFRLLTAEASPAGEQGSQGSWASVAVAHALGCLQHVESSWTRDRACVPGIGRWILNHRTAEETPRDTSHQQCTAASESLSEPSLEAGWVSPARQ